MADCECLKKCLFFNDKMAKKPVTAEFLKMSYCRGVNGKCARYLVFKKAGSESVPLELDPTQTHLLPEIFKALNLS